MVTKPMFFAYEEEKKEWMESMKDEIAKSKEMTHGSQ